MVRDWRCWKRVDKLKKVVNKLREEGGFIWWEEYEVLGRKYELDIECGSLHSWKEKIKMRNEKDWVEKVSSKSTLGQEVVRLPFRLGLALLGG